MRVARAFRLPIIAAMTALALSGCMHTSGPVAMAQPQSDLDSMAYGQPYYPASPATSVAIRRRRFRRRHRRASRQLCRGASQRCLRAGRRLPMPPRRCRSAYDAGLPARCRRQAAGRGLWPGRPHQHLCDRCRRLHHHAADRLGAGARPDARPGLPPKSPANCATAISAIPRWRSRSNPTGRSSSSAKSPPPANILTCPI